jgi:hypothetical protein
VGSPAAFHLLKLDILKTVLADIVPPCVQRCIQGSISACRDVPDYPYRLDCLAVGDAIDN